MRSKNSFFNILSTVLMQATSIFIGFITRKLFVDNLPIGLLGVSGLFNSFFSTIALIDIGFASILVYNLYKPLNENNEEKVKWLLSAFKKIYTVIAFLIFVISLALMPFIYTYFKIDYQNTKIVYLIYIIQLFTSISKYFFIHKVNIVTVAQQRWKINFVTLFLNIFWFLLKYVSIQIFKNYLLYLIVIFLDVLVINLINVYLSEKMYPYIKKLPNVKFKEIFNSGIVVQSKNFIYHTFYNFVYYNTDNFIIGIKLGTNPIGYLDNYIMIIKIFDEFISSIISSLRASFANYLHTEKNTSGLYDIYKMTNILNYFMSSIAIVGLYTMINKWIPIWLGEKYLVSSSISTLLIINLAIDLIFRPLENIYTVKGYIFQEKWPIFISAIVNLVVSLALVDKYGLAGVFFGTFLGKLIFWWGKLYYVTSDVFFETRYETLIDLLKLLFLLLTQAILINHLADMLFPIISSLAAFIIRGVFVVSLVLISNILIFVRTPHFKELIKLLFNTLKSFSKKKYT
ncbi:MAG: hypothetical protein GX368_00750 [Erysipelotrichaceae bacterium]|nr:hypothetical protein [Erysipelotrichaceae bacterium]